jgi:hypothetical protein
MKITSYITELFLIILYRVAKKWAYPSCISREFVFLPVESLSSDRLLVLATLGWLGLVTVQSHCNVLLGLKHEPVYHQAEVGDSGLASRKSLLWPHRGDSESKISSLLWCWTAKESNNVGVGKCAFIHYTSMNWVMPTWMHGKMHAERFLQHSVPNVPVVQCSSQMSALSTGVCILNTLSFGLRGTPIFTKSWRETHLTLWCGLDRVQHTFGAFFFHSSVTGQAYHDMLSEWLVPQLQQVGIKDTVVLQLDGAPPHFALHVHDYLNETFPGRWIGRGSEASPAPFARTPRSPDPTK